MDKVSIIIPCYNQAEYLPEAIDSALAQTYENVEIIVINDGSTDHTRQIMAEYTLMCSDIRMLATENRGLSAARNYAIERSEGNWIVCLDADDRLSPKYIEALIGKADIVCCGTQEFGISQRRWKTPLSLVEHRHLIKRNRLNYAAIYRKDIWRRAGGYDEDMCAFEDWDLWIRAAKMGYKILVVNEYLFHYRRKKLSMFTQAQDRRQEILDYMSQKHEIKIG